MLVGSLRFLPAVGMTKKYLAKPCHFDQRDGCKDAGDRAMLGAIAEKFYEKGRKLIITPNLSFRPQGGILKKLTVESF